MFFKKNRISVPMNPQKLGKREILHLLFTLALPYVDMCVTARVHRVGGGTLKQFIWEERLLNSRLEF